MNYFLLADTEFFRRINEAGDCNMETAYMAFANQVIELCGSIHASHTAIALAYIEIELQHHPVRLLSEERKEAAAYIGKALSFVRKMQKFLTTPQVPPLTSNIHSTNITAAKSETPKCQIDTLKCTLDELAVLDLIKKNPSVKQTELAEQTGKSVRSIKRITDSLKEKQYLRRVDGKRYGKWEVLA